MRWLRWICISILCSYGPVTAFSHGMAMRTRMHAVATTATTATTTTMSMFKGNQTDTDAAGNNMNIGHIIGDCCRKGMKTHNKQCGCLIVKLVSSLLPCADTIGHKVLHANNDFISYIMKIDDKKLSHKNKGRIILFSIRLAQWGDNFGGRVLQVYHDIVQKCFDDAD